MIKRKINIILFLLVVGMFSCPFFVPNFFVAKADTTTKVGKVISGPLTVRSGAGTNYSSLGSLKKDTRITIRGTKKDFKGQSWYLITYKSKNGYVYAKYVSVLSTTTIYSPKKTGQVNTGPLTVRGSASTSGKKYGTLAKGKKITINGVYITSSGSKWYKLTFNSKSSYVYAKYITLIKTATPVTPPKETITKYSPSKTGTTTDTINVRKGPSTKDAIYGTFVKNKDIELTAIVKNSTGSWYQTKYSGKVAYVSASYVKIKTTTPPNPSSPNMTAAQFETYMKNEGFPETYKPYLRNLYKAHPTWTFKAQKTGMTWSYVLSKEHDLGSALVAPSSPSSWKSKEKGAYISSTGKYVIFDGGWNQASDSIVAYYLDPRNFLNESNIYQFMDHRYKSGSSSTTTVKNLVSSNPCFMNTTSYISTLNTSGINSGVNPNVLTSMVILEQGWQGKSGLVSGTYSGYAGYYNHFNVGAYASGSMNAVQRGLWWAKGAGAGSTTYKRPWNTKEKSLTGGALFYGENYIKKNQYSFYTKKFNVMNGSSNAGSHEYSTVVTAATSEGNLLKYAYKTNNSNLTFYVPVFNSMPTKNCAKPI